MKIWNSPYQLGVRYGSLLRFEFDEIGFGFSDVFPWPEYGDLELKEQLKSLAQGKFTLLTEKSYIFARLDAQARCDNRSLFDNKVIPRSHCLFLPNTFSVENLENIISEGFKSVKFKVNQSINFLNSIPSKIDLKIRLDFNAKMDANKFLAFISDLKPHVRGKIEFVEDPFPFEKRSWQDLNQKIPLALDNCNFGIDTNLSNPGFKYQVLKPARQKTLEVQLPNEITPVIAGYLDHPVGQCFAAWEATQWKGPLVDTGLTYHQCYDKNSYSDRLSIKAGCLRPETTVGVGFGDLLEKENWKLIYAD